MTLRRRSGATTPVTDAKEHVMAVRVYDRYENVVGGEGGGSLMRESG